MHFFAIKLKKQLIISQNYRKIKRKIEINKLFSYNMIVIVTIEFILDRKITKLVLNIVN